MFSHNMLLLFFPKLYLSIMMNLKVNSVYANITFFNLVDISLDYIIPFILKAFLIFLKFCYSFPFQCIYLFDQVHGLTLS